MRADLKNLATFEEVFYVDHHSYTTDVAALARVGSIRVSEGAALAIAVDDAGQRYCICAAAAGSTSEESTFTTPPTAQGYRAGPGAGLVCGGGRVGLRADRRRRREDLPPEGSPGA